MRIGRRLPCQSVLRTAFTELAGVRHPVVQAPMAGVSGGALAGAVAAAGGLGFLGVGARDAEKIAPEAQRARDAGGRFGIGLMAWALERDPALFDAALAAEPFALSVSFGDVAPWLERAREHGLVTFVQVQDAQSARAALDAGADVLVAQGTEGGGHTGAVGTLPLLQVVLPPARAAAVPVLAAGGVASGAALAGALAMGADGVWVGTRFAASEEALGTAAAKARIVAAGADDTVLTRVFDLAIGAAWPERFPGRALRNAFSDRWHGREGELAPGSHADAIAAARGRDDWDEAYIYAGQASGAIETVEPAARIVERLVADAEALLRDRVPGLLS
jgi:nitronate monooxygenase